ncbi:MAG TPA: hypothetical protein VK207_10655 [Bacteroidales bacterium]|nr:hypothetical protein [Bacteroidales bacterium]
MKNVIAITLYIFALTFPARGQDENKKAELKGYVSSLTSTMFRELSSPIQIDNIIHNRLNFKAWLNPKLTFAAEARNRIFMGDMVSNPGTFYSSMISSDRGLMDMSWNLASEQSFFINTTIDRLWLDYRTGKFQATAGRQRINWGQALVWNPNDIFNTYSYFDFDYVERPGSDALRLQYYPGSSSAIELALKANSDKEITAAALYRFNKWSYDFQFLSGIMDNDQFVAGLGWSGAIGSVSFRGEGTWFRPLDNTLQKATTLITVGFDKVFVNNSMAQAQVLFSNKKSYFDDVRSLFSLSEMSVKDIAFSRFTAFSSYSYPVTPLFTAAVSGMWFPDRKGYFTGLSADYSVAENVDLTLLWQHFKGDFGHESDYRINLGFLRIKISF